MNGLRGIGALSVYIYHTTPTFFPTNGRVYEEESGGSEPSWEVWIKGTPLIVFALGTFWVKVFFLLSGFVLPLGFFKT